MERMGMGNMYVHVLTFALLCAAPVLVFAVAALNIHDATLGYLVGATGSLLSVQVAVSSSHELSVSSSTDKATIQVEAFESPVEESVDRYITILLLHAFLQQFVCDVSFYMSMQSHAGSDVVSPAVTLATVSDLDYFQVPRSQHTSQPKDIPNEQFRNGKRTPTLSPTIRPWSTLFPTLPFPLPVPNFITCYVPMSSSS